MSESAVLWRMRLAEVVCERLGGKQEDVEVLHNALAEGRRRGLALHKPLHQQLQVVPAHGRPQWPMIPGEEGRQVGHARTCMCPVQQIGNELASQLMSNHQASPGSA